MGKIILGILILVETVFLIRRVKTGQNHKKERSLAAVLLFGIFAMGCLTGIVQWSFRYYLLGACLLVQALSGAVFLLKKKEDQPVKSRGKTVMKFLGAAFLYGFVCTLAILFPQYKELQPSGAYTVKTAAETYVDTERVETFEPAEGNREVNVRFWYPEEGGDGEYPLVIFSHGSSGISLTNVSLFTELASNGYVVCSIDHPYHAAFTSSTEGKITTVSGEFQQEFQQLVATDDLETEYQIIKGWMELRMGDINFVLDTILSRAGKGDVPAQYQNIDRDKIAVCGHSLGGSAALGMGRLREDVDAVMALESPYMYEVTGVTEQGEEFTWIEEPYPIPVLHIYSDSTWGRFEQDPLYEKNEQALKSEGETVYNVYLQGCGHMDLTELALISPVITHIMNGESGKTDASKALGEINRQSLQFLDYWLLGKGQEPVSGTVRIS